MYAIFSLTYSPDSYYYSNYGFYVVLCTSWLIQENANILWCPFKSVPSGHKKNRQNGLKSSGRISEAHFNNGLAAAFLLTKSIHVLKGFIVKCVQEQKMYSSILSMQTLCKIIVLALHRQQLSVCRSVCLCSRVLVFERERERERAAEPVCVRLYASAQCDIVLIWPYLLCFPSLSYRSYAIRL